MTRLCRLKTPFAGLSHLRAVAPPLLRLLRSYGTSSTAAAAAAALPQLDPDYCHYDSQQNEYESPRRRDRPSPAAITDSEGSVPPRGVQWVFIGNPGTKKHVYAETLSKLLEVPHISMGSLVRQDLSPRSSLYKQIANAVNEGSLVPEDIIFGLLSKRLEDGYCRGESGFILDGIPRTQTQAGILDQLVDIDLVVNFKCTEDCLPEQSGNSILSHHCESLCLSNSASTGLDMASEHAPSKFSASREDHTWKGKVQIYAKQIKPLEDYYRKQKKLLSFQVGSAPGETWQGLLAALHLQHINAFHSKLPLGSSWL